MKSRKVVCSAVLVVLLAVAMLGIYGVTRPETHSGEKNITVEVIHKNESIEEFTYQTKEEYLGACLLAEGLIKGEAGAYGLYILEVDGESAVYEVDQSYWALYANGEYASVGIDQMPIEDGDHFSLIYTIG